MRALILSIATAALLGGCYLTHGETGGSCDGVVCGEGNYCCEACDGRSFCQSLDLPCESRIRECGTCSSGFDCGEGEVCRFEPGVCSFIGRCVAGPAVCPADCPGVCGCDGFDYCNECEASQLGGGGVAFPGTCFSEGCGFSGEVCGPRQTCCPTCDGDLACLDSDGFSCPDLLCGGCELNEDCRSDEYCAFSVGLCGGIGECERFPEGCDDDCPGVCGCDGFSYCNACNAAELGINLERLTTCETPCGRGGVACGPGEYCGTGGDCGALDDFGCESRPLDCEDTEDPVCGCDGRVYLNECEANRLGVSAGDPERCECLDEPCPRHSCRAHQLANPGSPSGTYPILDPSTGSVWELYCDMEVDGGGWTLVAASAFEPLSDEASDYYPNLSTARPFDPARGVFRGMRASLPLGRSDVRFVCGAEDADGHFVDISVYDVRWYHEWTRGTEAQSCFSEEDGAGADRPAPARRNNRNGRTLNLGDNWSSGYLEGEDSCNSPDDFTVDFDDRGMDSDEMDGTDWGADDGYAKCGAREGFMGMYWSIFVRE